MATQGSLPESHQMATASSRTSLPEDQHSGSISSKNGDKPTDEAIEGMAIRGEVSSDKTSPASESLGKCLASREDDDTIEGASSCSGPTAAEEHMKDEDLGHTATRMPSRASIAETMPLYRELLFVFVVCLSQLFTQAGFSQVIAIIHVIGEFYGIDNTGDISWFISGYSLTVGTFILFSGRLGDLFGYKKMFLIGMAWYSVWSLVCGLAVFSNHVLFIFGRVLQGIGPALCLTNGLALLGATYAPGKRKNLAFAAFGATAPTGAVLGQLFSSLFAQVWWPWAFWCFSIVLAATCVIAYYAIPPTPASHGAHRATTLRGKILQLDLPGTLTGVTGLILFNFAWNQAPIVGWAQPYVYVTLILGLLFVGAFFYIEIYLATDPLLPFDALSTDVSFVLGAMACGWACFGIFFWYTWQFFLVLREAPPIQVSAWFVTVSPSGLVAAFFTGLLLHRLGPSLVMTISLCAFTVGTILMATAPVDQIYWSQTFVAFLIMPWGMDMSFPAATLIVSNAVAKRHQGIAASLINTVVNYSIALGLGFAGTVEYRVNNGGLTSEDKLKGYRGAYYMGIGLAALGLAISICYVAKTHWTKRSRSQEKV